MGSMGKNQTTRKKSRGKRNETGNRKIQPRIWLIIPYGARVVVGMARAGSQPKKNRKNDSRRIPEVEGGSLMSGKTNGRRSYTSKLSLKFVTDPSFIGKEF